MTEIHELKTREEWREAYPVMHELRLDLDESAYLSFLDKMVTEGYRLFALRDGGTIVSLAGIAVLTNFYYGRHVWVYDLVTSATARSQGHGQTLLQYVENFARDQGCAVVALASNLERLDAHRFYQERMEYQKPSYVFKKILPPGQPAA